MSRKSWAMGSVFVIGLVLATGVLAGLADPRWGESLSDNELGTVFGKQTAPCVTCLSPFQKLTPQCQTDAPDPCPACTSGGPPAPSCPSAYSFKGLGVLSVTDYNTQPGNLHLMSSVLVDCRERYACGSTTHSLTICNNGVCSTPDAAKQCRICFRSGPIIQIDTVEGKVCNNCPQ